MGDAICSIPGCERKVEYRARQLCRRCYKRVTAKRKGARASKFTPDVTRFEARIVQGPVPDYAPTLGRCWLWTGALNRGSEGYGTFTVQGRKSAYAHRWSYEYHRAPIPEGLEIDHLCRVTKCVNPWHLEPVTSQVNSERIPYALQTHCSRGHELTEENTYVSSAGRTCRTCRREYNREYAREARKAARSDTCKNGHPLSGDNLVEKPGIRVCRACRRRAAAITNAKRWGTPIPEETP